MITVLVLTHNRPHLLQRALRSILNQDLDLVHKVIISDNSDNDESREVVSSFNSPLFVYDKIDPPHIDWVRRFRELFAQVKSPYFAILHDDDWWHPDHLKANYMVLERNISCNLSVSTFLTLCEARTLIRREFPLSELLLALSGKHISTPEIKITKAVGYAFSLMGGFSHFSTMVGRASLIDELEEIYDDKLFTYDTDRLIFFMAVKQGTPVHLTSPSVTIVETGNQASLKYISLASSSIRTTSNFIFSRINPELLSEITGLIDRVASESLTNRSPRLAKTIRDFSEYCPLDTELLQRMPNYRELIRKRSLHDKIKSRVSQVMRLI